MITTFEITLDPIVLAIPVFFVLIGAELLWDHFSHRKHEARVYRLNDALANISCGIIDQVSGVFAKVITVGAYALVFTWAQGVVGISIPSNWFWYIVAFVAVDFSYYWSHRISHQVNLFWVGHVVHHQSEDYNLSVALRQGAFQKVLMFWIYMPLAILGFPTEWFLLSFAVNLLYQFWIHTEAIKRMGPFEWIFNTPSHHRVHHGRNPKYIDKNHAGVFIIWDRIFGTFQQEEEHPTYGITRPTNTFNPVWAHVQPFARLVSDVRAIPGVIDKLRFLFHKPGWYPASVGGPQPPLPIEQQPPKFLQKPSTRLSIYTIVQYVFVLIITSFYLFNLDLMSALEHGLMVAFIVLFVLNLGFIFDFGRRYLVLEWVRTLGALGLAYYFWDTTTLPVLAIAFAINCLISYIGLFLLPNRNKL